MGGPSYVIDNSTPTPGHSAPYHEGVSMLRRRIIALVAASLTFGITAAYGQTPTYPAKNVRIIVGLAPGGTTDVFTRILAQRLTEAWGQNVIVENRPGASGMIGADAVAKS